MIHGKPPREKKMTSVLEQLQKLDEQRSKLLEGAKTEALAKAEAAVKELNALGFNYSLSESVTTKKAAKGITRQRDPNKLCDVCGFLTEPNHDGRKHRSQGDNKKPFTAKELAEFGMTKKA